MGRRGLRDDDPSGPPRHPAAGAQHRAAGHPGHPAPGADHHPRPRGPYRRRRLAVAEVGLPDPRHSPGRGPAARQVRRAGAGHRRHSRHRARRALESGPFTLRYLPVTHSIPESCALLLAAGEHRVLHTGDWKLDAEPLIGRPISAATFRAIAPVDLVVADSTNAPLPGHSRSEGEVARALEHTIAACRGRVIVSCFASNLARVLAIGRAAHRAGRRVSLMGRSMERMVAVARGLGYLDDFPALVPTADLGYLPPEEVLVIATGSQGEPRAALSRLARGRHHAMELGPGDSVIFSAKAIP